MKKIILRIEAISDFNYRLDGKERAEILHYSDGTSDVVFTFYKFKNYPF